MGFVRKLRSIALVALAALGPAACIADPVVPCGAFEPGEARENVVVRAQAGPIAAMAMKDAFVLRNLCDGPDGECRVDKLPLPELAPGSQVMLTTAGRFLVGIDHDDGGVWTYVFDEFGRRIDKRATYVHETDGPAQLVIGMRDSNTLIVRDRQDRLGRYNPGDYRAAPIAPELGDYLRLAAVGESHVALKVLHSESSQTIHVVDVETDETRAFEVATGDFTSVVFGADDQTLVLSEGRGADAMVMVFDVESRTLLDAFAGEIISSRQQNDKRALEELPGLHAVSPSGEQVAYRTTSGALAVRKLQSQSSCLVRNTNRLGTGSDSRRAGNHAVAGFSADGLIYAEYNVGTTESFVYAYDPRHQQISVLGEEESGWHLAAVPGRVTDIFGEIERLWAIGVRQGSHASIGEGNADGQSIGSELTFVPMADENVWAIDTKDQVVDQYRAERALSVRRVAPPQWSQGRLRFEQPTDDQVVTHYQGEDSQGPLRVPLSGRVCMTSSAPGFWAYRCGDSTGNRSAFTTDSGAQEQTNDPNLRPEFDPPFPDQGGGGSGSDDDPSRN